MSNDAGIGSMQKILTIFVSLCLALYFVVGAGICLCTVSDDHSASEAAEEHSSASHVPSQGSSGAVTASLADHHDGEDECNHAAPGTQGTPAVIKGVKSSVLAMPAVTCSVSTQWPSPVDIEAPSIAGVADCEHHWLISLRSIVLLI